MEWVNIPLQGLYCRLVSYESGDYTRINPAMDEHGEINILIFNIIYSKNSPSSTGGR